MKGDLRDAYGSLISSQTAGSSTGPPSISTTCYDDPGNNDYIAFFTTHEGFLNGVSVNADYLSIYQLGMK